ISNIAIPDKYFSINPSSSLAAYVLRASTPTLRPGSAAATLALPVITHDLLSSVGAVRLAGTDNAMSRHRVPEFARARAFPEPDRGPFPARSKSCKDGHAGTIPVSHTRMANTTPLPSKRATPRPGGPILAAD